MTNGDLQDKFLSEFKESEVEVTVFLVNGFQMRGTVIDFDKFVIQLHSGGKNHLIYKHAISTFTK
ncbi:MULTISPECIES: RNA chaperone Hfq [Salinicoccus]|uniref:RNA-binding protein Hfq n=2 Tax=Salinicoccus TaxID=45669 RepID=A0A0C2DLV2_9STAP|nr:MULTISPECIES: RNA chaperone Hfq [Salinicoccus]KIH70993.1 RNA-binding protein [Salinicoccus roseus]MBY8908820.1 RNA chaperone Hfq [Salinicoccus roseus]MCC4722002.1 RNA chaperone Hfq [Salinicoccus sp. RF5]MCG7332650.1 RNA chaperone Hfq [Salinicoccus roseus]MDB0580220.1 RNA chaperone Hfq [Salinicoccus roseus]